MMNRPSYLFGTHDVGGAEVMLQCDKPGWVLSTHALMNERSVDRSWYQDRGFGVICRLNYGYSPHGTVGPNAILSTDMPFAQMCAEFVAASRGCDIWIIGNEPNHANERYHGQIYHPYVYAGKFLDARERIKNVPGHEDDQVIVAAVAPWDCTSVYYENQSGDWLVYFRQMLTAIGSNEADGVALHTYTHGSNPNLIFGGETMGPPYEDRFYNFAAYRDFIKVMSGLDYWSSKPIYITETDMNTPWTNNRENDYEWMRNAYGDVLWFNRQLHMKLVKCLLLYRWETHDQWSIKDKPKTVEAFRQIVAEA